MAGRSYPVGSTAATRLAAYGLASLVQDERSDRQRRHWVRPRNVPHRVNGQSQQSDDRKISAQRGFNRIRP